MIFDATNWFLTMLKRLLRLILPKKGTAMIIDLAAQDVHDKLMAHEIVLVDVREPREFASERIHGALNFPLSTFDPAFLPINDKTLIVFQCGTGKRSAMAGEKAAALLGGQASHLAGGIAAWKETGLKTINLDPSTGAVIDPGA
jgi:rhodanese-related sulfurtransferase